MGVQTRIWGRRFLSAMGVQTRIGVARVITLNGVQTWIGVAQIRTRNNEKIRVPQIRVCIPIHHLPQQNSVGVYRIER